MTDKLVSLTANLSPSMRNISSCRSDEPQPWLSRSILPAILRRAWGASTWQYIVLFLVGLVVYDQGNHCSLARKYFD